MFKAKILFSIVVNGQVRQYEECTCLIVNENQENAVQLIEKKIEEKSGSFINKNGDMVCWSPVGILEFEPIAFSENPLLIDSRLHDTVSGYTLDTMFRKFDTYK